MYQLKHMRQIITCAVVSVLGISQLGCIFFDFAQEEAVQITIEDEHVIIANEVWELTLVPHTLQLIARPKGFEPIELAHPDESLGLSTRPQKIINGIKWEIPAQDLIISFQLEADQILVNFQTDTAGEFTWPQIALNDPIDALILPLNQGNYIPIDNIDWQNYLTSAEFTALESLSMPFWGLSTREYTVSYQLTNPFDDYLRFQQADGRFDFQLTHEFRNNWDDKEFGYVIQLGEPSPVAPAQHYRDWLIANDNFVTLNEKIAQTPNAEKLLGAAHVWLWGMDVITTDDITDWVGFVRTLSADAQSSASTPGKTIWQHFTSETQSTVEQLSRFELAEEMPYALQTLVCEALSDVLALPMLYDPIAWTGFDTNPAVHTYLNQGIENLNYVELVDFNGLLLASAYPDYLADHTEWGFGVSMEMLDTFAEAKLDRLWLGLDSWTGGFHHPDVIARAIDMGYLIAPYDSYHSIHHPDQESTWETAQFDAELYENGAILRWDGTPRTGFNGVGRRLSPLVAQPYVEERVNGIMDMVTYNSWFIDCDAAGEFFDDYAPDHLANKREDMQARLARMAWIRDEYNLVVGSEGGSAYSASTVHFVHGMLTPVIGWDDPDLQDKELASPYFLGDFAPTESPAVFVQRVPLKPVYYPIYFDPRFRLPLYEIVFHDSVIATHHWGFGSLKFADQVESLALMELLYNVPPFYHLNPAQFEIHGDWIKRQYAFFSPLHRQIGSLPMTRFEWLSENRLIQLTKFGDEVEMVANFGDDDFVYEGNNIPPHSILARQIATDAVQIFTP